MWPQRPDAAPAVRPGSVIRLARHRAGLTLAQLGAAAGYSGSTMSRIERDQPPVRDIVLLRRLGQILRIPPAELGLAPTPAKSSSPWQGEPRVIPGRCEEDEAAVRRRQMLAGLSGLAVPTAVPASAVAGDDPAGRSVRDLTNALVRPLPATSPPGALTVAQALARARDQFHACRYSDLAARLPMLLAGAVAQHEQASGDERQAASAVLADAYNLATRLAIKLDADELGAIASDRAITAARASGDPLTTAEATRMVSSVLRRAGHHSAAQELLLGAAGELSAAGQADPELWSVLGGLWCTAAYTAAQDGNRDQAKALIAEADAVARRLGRDSNLRFTAFGPTQVTLHQISVHRLLGDAGRAIQAARALRANTIGVPERRARYWLDIARAFDQWNKPESCYRALISAHQAAPQEVAGRPVVRSLVAALRQTDRAHALPGLREFACQVQAADS